MSVWAHKDFLTVWAVRVIKWCSRRLLLTRAYPVKDSTVYAPYEISTHVLLPVRQSLGLVCLSVPTAYFRFICMSLCPSALYVRLSDCLYALSPCVVCLLCLSPLSVCLSLCSVWSVSLICLYALSLCFVCLSALYVCLPVDKSLFVCLFCMFVCLMSSMLCLSELSVCSVCLSPCWYASVALFYMLVCLISSTLCLPALSVCCLLLYLPLSVCPVC